MKDAYNYPRRLRVPTGGLMRSAGSTSVGLAEMQVCGDVVAGKADWGPSN